MDDAYYAMCHGFTQRSEIRKEFKGFIGNTYLFSNERISGSGNNGFADHAPVWIPDNEASRCMVCKRTQFNLVQRRVSN